jgi:hypothetical protein
MYNKHNYNCAELNIAYSNGSIAIGTLESMLKFVTVWTIC